MTIIFEQLPRCLKEAYHVHDRELMQHVAAYHVSRMSSLSFMGGDGPYRLSWNRVHVALVGEVAFIASSDH